MDYSLSPRNLENQVPSLGSCQRKIEQGVTRSKGTYATKKLANKTHLIEESDTSFRIVYNDQTLARYFLDHDGVEAVRLLNVKDYDSQAPLVRLNDLMNFSLEYRRVNSCSTYSENRILFAKKGWLNNYHYLGDEDDIRQETVWLPVYEGVKFRRQKREHSNQEQLTFEELANPMEHVREFLLREKVLRKSVLNKVFSRDPVAHEVYGLVLYAINDGSVSTKRARLASLLHFDYYQLEGALRDDIIPKGPGIWHFNCTSLGKKQRARLDEAIEKDDVFIPTDPQIPDGEVILKTQAFFFKPRLSEVLERMEQKYATRPAN